MFLDSSPIKNPHPTTAEYINSPSVPFTHTIYIYSPKKIYKFKPHASACILKLHCKIFIINGFLLPDFLIARNTYPLLSSGRLSTSH